jgi:hypothetical protein
MAYVDLNPVRAKMAPTPGTSAYTSIQRRIKVAIQGEQSANLLTFVGNEHQHKTKWLFFNLTDYIALVEVTGRCIRSGKRGYIDESQANILTRLNISAENWLILTTQFTRSFHGAVGHTDVLNAFCQHQALSRRTTLSACNKLLA